MELKFEWDEDKGKLNQKKHGVSFEEAASIFNDPLSINFDDPEHSLGENRYIIIGLSNKGRYLFVSHTDRDDKIRLISARLVTPKERRYYERENTI
ncbi:BrnT family toxin [Aphanizomenon flos-aquae]|uniref:BrnT family toxin n=1 Tax=Aphanizomenon flos-aquae TaxID=1176 RepID=UPI000483D3B2|nr:BrnT family toxin [Aphanizomenon flos-aquae]